MGRYPISRRDDDVPDGKLTSFPMTVKKEKDDLSQAILDAKSVAACLAKAPSIEAALAAYDEECRTATQAIVLANRKGRPEGVIDMVDGRYA